MYVHALRPSVAPWLNHLRAMCGGVVWSETGGFYAANADRGQFFRPSTKANQFHRFHLVERLLFWPCSICMPSTTYWAELSQRYALLDHNITIPKQLLMVSRDTAARIIVQILTPCNSRCGIFDACFEHTKSITNVHVTKNPKTMKKGIKMKKTNYKIFRFCFYDGENLSQPATILNVVPKLLQTNNKNCFAGHTRNCGEYDYV